MSDLFGTFGLLIPLAILFILFISGVRIVTEDERNAKAWT
jgi:hypothetical protein